MKKIAILSLVAIAFVAMAFSPRFGTRSGGDNTGRMLTYASNTTQSYKASISVTPSNTFENFVRIDSLDGNSTDGAATVTIATTNAKQWDKVTLLFDSVNVDASRVVTFSTGTLPNSTLTIAKGKTAVVEFIYDETRAKYIEKCRNTGL